MEEVVGFEINAKVSDSAYSNSCSNSQSRRSHSSKSTNSGSHSSGSSGYGGKPSIHGDKSGQPAEKSSQDSEVKQKNQEQIEKPIEEVIKNEGRQFEQLPDVETNAEETENGKQAPSPQAAQSSDLTGLASPEISSSKEEDGFSCVISMHDGVVMYATASLTTSLGFPKDMWIGRSFIDFVHLKDRNTFASHISSGLALPKNVNGTVNEVPNEMVSNAVPFVIRHAANGNVEYIDPDSGPYLGYLPQDLEGKNALLLYHPADLPYLRHVYENIVKEGGLPRSKPIRLLTQNRDFVKVETEWSSFVNPWTKKLEFVIGKHYVVEGPRNPDVFKSPEDKIRPHEMDEKAQSIRESIVRITNEYKVLTKLAEVAKQQMTKRCQDLATVMESLMEDQPKAEEEMHLEIQDPDNSYYERDSVMLGGISPHHDHNDSKSSVETTLSYNQLNYNKTLQRFFDSHDQLSDDCKVIKEDMFALENCESPNMDSVEMCLSDSGGGGISPTGYYPPTRLTETSIKKHNTKMEKELMKMHREIRYSSKDERKKSVKEDRQKKKEHWARCNAGFQPTNVKKHQLVQAHGTKRSLKEAEPGKVSHEHTHPGQRKLRRKQTSSTAAHPSPPVTVTATMPTPHNPPQNNMNTYIMGMGYPPPISMMSPASSVPAGLIPLYYAPASQVSDSANVGSLPGRAQFPQPMQYFMYGPPMMYTPYSPQLPYCQSRPNDPINHRHDSANWNFRKSTDATFLRATQSSNVKQSSDEAVDRTDGESSYSSFYSSFFRTESGSAEESGDLKNADKMGQTTHYNRPPMRPQLPKRKSDLSCIEKVCWTSELMYKYQIVTKSMEEVLMADKLRMNKLKQPSLVSDQLAQLYLDLQLEGVTARLTLEEGISCSSSSGEESSAVCLKARTRSKQKRDYSKLAMVFEEDTPFPPTPTSSPPPSSPLHSSPPPRMEITTGSDTPVVPVFP